MNIFRIIYTNNQWFTDHKLTVINTVKLRNLKSQYFFFSKDFHICNYFFL